MRNESLALAALVFLGGCTFSQDGVGVWWPVETPEQSFQDRRAQLVKNAHEAGMNNVSGEDVGVLVTGSTGPYRQFSETNVEKFYEKYAEQARKHRTDDQPNYDLERFRSEYSGWTSVSPVAIPGVAKVMVQALVPGEFIDSVEFSSGITSFLVGDTDDYVVARTNPDGAFYIFKLLCPDNSDYFRCTIPYASGFFDQLTGQEVNPKTGVPRKDGDIIDPKTFVKMRRKD